MTMDMSGRIQAGRLRTPVTIQQNVGTKDSRGQQQESWQTFATVRAEVEPSDPRRSVERGAAAQVLAEQWYTIKARWRDGVRPKMRALMDGHTLDINAVIDPDRRRHAMILHCLERGATGTVTA